VSLLDNSSIEKELVGAFNDLFLHCSFSDESEIPAQVS
jgi:hypothetical protein